MSDVKSAYGEHVFTVPTEIAYRYEMNVILFPSAEKLIRAQQIAAAVRARHPEMVVRRLTERGKDE